MVSTCNIWLFIALTMMIVLAAIAVGYFIKTIVSEVKGINISFLVDLLYYIIFMLFLVILALFLLDIMLKHQEVIHRKGYARPYKLTPT